MHQELIMKLLSVLLVISSFVACSHKPVSFQHRNPASSNVNMKKFQTIVFDNGSFALKGSDNKKISIKDLFADSLFSGLSINTPEVKCTGTVANEECVVTWTSAKYVYLSGEKPNDKWKQEDDCVRAINVKMKQSKVVSGEIVMEMCGW